MSEQGLYVFYLWVILSLPAVRVIINHVLGRKEWVYHDEFSAIFSTTALFLGLLLILPAVLVEITLWVIG